MTREAISVILTAVANEQGIDLSRLPPERTILLRRRSTACFGAEANGALTTESLDDCAKLTRKESWELIAGFSWDDPVILFANPRDSMAMFEVPSLDDALTLLGEAPPFDFYLIDESCTFLFAHDQYDNLFGCGLAKEFVETAQEV